MMQSFLIAGIAFVIGAPAPKEAPKKEALPATLGMWEVEKMIAAGRDIPSKPVRFEFKKDGKVVNYRRPDDKGSENTYKLDESKDPAELDWALDGKAEQTLKFIYKIAGDKLTLCFEDGFDSKRPKQFESRPGTKQMIWTLKRVEVKKE